MGLDLPPGQYRIAAETADPSVVPFYAERILESDVRWRSIFYIR